MKSLKGVRSVCTVAGCGKVGQTRLGLCREHYDMQRRHGDPLYVRERAHCKEVQGFLSNVAMKYEADDCLDWPYASRGDGYGVININGKAASAHREVCKAVHGEAPTALHEVAHGCGRRSCVNPRHLRWATRSENHMDKYLHGTMLMGSKCPHAILSEKDVIRIRERLRTEMQMHIAADFGVSRTTISKIALGKSWAWLA